MAIPISLYYSSQVWGSLGWLNGLADLKENWSWSKRVYFLYSKLSRSVSTSTNSADKLQIPSRQTFFVRRSVRSELVRAVNRPQSNDRYFDRSKNTRRRRGRQSVLHADKILFPMWHRSWSEFHRLSVFSNPIIQFTAYTQYNQHIKLNFDRKQPIVNFNMWLVKIVKYSKYFSHSQAVFKGLKERVHVSKWRGSRLLGPARESWQGQTCHKLSHPILFQGLKVELVMVKVLVAPLDNYCRLF